MRIKRLAALPLMLGLTSADLPPELDPSLRPYADLLIPSSSPEPGKLRVRFLGVSTLALSDGDTSILIDGFFSRPPRRQVLDLRRAWLKPVPASIAGGLDRAGISTLNMIVTAHSHYDHAMDAGYIAKDRGALLVGSSSTAWIGRAAGLPEQRICVIEARQTIAAGRFRVTTIPTVHAFPNLARGHIERPLNVPARSRDYKEGGSLSLLVEHDELKMLIHATAGFRKGDMAGIQADVVFLGIGGTRPVLGYGSYWRELVRRTDAALVIPIHWDNFFRPLDQPFTPLPGFALSIRKLKKLAETDRRTVSLMPPFAPIDIETWARRARNAMTAKPVAQPRYSDRSPRPVTSEARCPPVPVHRRTS